METTDCSSGMVCSKCGRTVTSVTYTPEGSLCSECCPPPEMTFICTGCIEKDNEIKKLASRVEFLEALIQLIHVTAKDETMPDWLKAENIEGVAEMGKPLKAEKMPLPDDYSPPKITKLEPGESDER